MKKLLLTTGLALIFLSGAAHAQPPAPVPARTPDIPTGLLFVDAATYQSIPLASSPLMGDLPTAVDLSPHFPTPGNQGRQSSCVGWAVAYALKSAQETQERRWRPDDPSRVFSPSFIYNQINLTRDCRAGTMFVDALNLLRRDGVATMGDFPYAEGACAAAPDAAVKQRAKEFRIAEWRRVNVQDETEIKSQLAAGFPVLFGMVVDEAFHALRGSTPYRQFSGVNLGGHAMVVVGYDDSKSAFKVINSWGTEWGEGGFGWISYTAFRQAVREGYVAQDIVINRPPDVAPSPAPSPSPGPPGPVPNPAVAVGVPQIEHNIVVPNNLPPPNNFAMRIRLPGTISNAAGKKLQLVVRFNHQNGQPMFANPQEPLFRDVQGLVATGTPALPVSTQNISLNELPMVIPYYALNLQPTGGQVGYTLTLTVSVYLDNYIVAQTQPTPFNIRW